MVSQHGHSTEYNSFVLIFYDIIRSYVISYTHIRDVGLSIFQQYRVIAWKILQKIWKIEEVLLNIVFPV